MKGWKTWAGAFGFIAVGVVLIATGDIAGGAKSIATGVGLVGLGHKIEKSASQGK